MTVGVENHTLSHQYSAIIDLDFNLLSCCFFNLLFSQKFLIVEDLRGAYALRGTFKEVLRTKPICSGPFLPDSDGYSFGLVSSKISNSSRGGGFSVFNFVPKSPFEL